MIMVFFLFLVANPPEYQSEYLPVISSLAELVRSRGVDIITTVIDKFENVNFLKGITGAPMVTDWSVSALEAKVVRTLELDTHVLFVGSVVGSKFIKEATPLTYADYHLIKKGKSPKTAPTFGFNAIK